MMTSTFPTSRTNSRELRIGLKEIQHKKETLLTLEAALKKRIDEFRELCLKEGELTGQLPIDYPLQPREPIPQVRRRITRSQGNIPNTVGPTNSIAQPPPLPLRARHNYQQQVQRLQQEQATNFPLPSRPTSTNSSSSSTSTASSNTRSINSAPSNLNNNYQARGLHQHSHSMNLKPLVHNDNMANFQPYYEETKPFQMSDFYKYSSKHRQKILSDPNSTESQQQQLTNIVNNHTKTTRQLQDEIVRTKNSLKFATCDDPTQPTVNIFEKSGQKLIEATARAIAGNPSLAEKLNNILPNHGERY